LIVATQLPGEQARCSFRLGSAPWAGLRALAQLLTLAFLTLPAPALADNQLTFGVYASDKPSAMVEQLRPTLDRLSARLAELLGEPVSIRLQVAKNYDEGVRQIIEGAVDFTRLGPASYVHAKDENANLDILALEKIEGAKVFHGVICVHENSDIHELADLRGRTFAFGAKDSTLGRYFAQLHLARAGIHEADLKHYEYLGRHDKVGTAVGSRLFDAGALEETMFRKLVASGVPIRALATFPNATRPWVARAELGPQVKDALRTALLELHDNDALTALRSEGFLPGDDSDFALTRVAIRENWRFFQQPGAKGPSN
jgi:phosphonate transport system substrate-binding protein